MKTNRRAFAILIGCLLPVALVAGCASTPAIKPRMLSRVFAAFQHSPSSAPVIFIPGVLGAVLEDTATKEVIWGPNGARKLDRLALPIDADALANDRDAIAAKNILRRVDWIPHLAEFHITEDLRSALVNAGGYQKGNLEDPKPGENCFPFWYDWRRDLVEAAQRLGAAIERLKERTGDPDLKVQLVCHSTGGLIARYYVKYGMEDVLDEDPLPPPTYAGARHVSKVIMLGTPNRGSMDMFKVLNEGIRVPAMGYLKSSVLFTMPAAYQLLPYEGEPMLVDGDGRFLAVSLYEAGNWETYGWSVFAPGRLSSRRHELLQQDSDHGLARYRKELETQRRFLRLALTRAHRFHQVLEQGDAQDDPVEYLLMGSDCQPTLQRALLVKEGLTWRTEFSTSDPWLKRKLFAMGDGSVTARSLVGPWQSQSNEEGSGALTHGLAQAVFVCEAHTHLIQNVTYLSNVLHALLDPQSIAQHRKVCALCQGRLAAVRSYSSKRRRDAHPEEAVVRRGKQP